MEHNVPRVCVRRIINDKLNRMTEFKKKVQSIIEDYCEGINHLEFSIDNFPEMLDRIETEALRIHDVVGQSEQFKCEKCGSDWGEVRATCFSCNHESEDLST